MHSLEGRIAARSLLSYLDLTEASKNYLLDEVKRCRARESTFVETYLKGSGILSAVATAQDRQRALANVRSLNYCYLICEVATVLGGELTDGEVRAISTDPRMDYETVVAMTEKYLQDSTLED